MSDMKQLLLNLGSRLVEKHDFSPASLGSQKAVGKNTEQIVQFLRWLDSTPEAREELGEMGYDFIQTPKAVFRKSL